MPRSIARLAVVASCAAILALQLPAAAGAEVHVASAATYEAAYQGYGATDLVGVSCPTTQLCLAVGHAAEPSSPSSNWIARYSMLFRSTDGGATWSPAPEPGGVESSYVDGTQSMGVSCASASFCVLQYDTSLGDFPIIQFDVSHDGGVTWKSTGEIYLNGGYPWVGLQDFSCLDVSTCVGILSGKVASTTDGGANWVLHPRSAGATAISCTSTRWCFILQSSFRRGGYQLRLSTSTNRGGTLAPVLNRVGTIPGAAAAWNALPLLSCSTASSCSVLTSGNIALLDTTTSTGHSWHAKASPLSYLQKAETLACLTPSECSVLATQPAAPTHIVSVSTNNGGASWNDGAVGVLGFPTAIPSLSCQATGACLATLGGPAIKATSDAQGASPVWSSTLVGTGARTMTAVACEAAGSCLAIGSGIRSISADDGSTWSEHSDPALTGDTFQSLSCPFGSTCFAAGSSGSATPVGVLLLTTDLGADWTSVSLPWEVGSVTDVTCASTTTCLAIPGFASAFANVPTFVLRSTDGGLDWSLVQLAPASAGLTISAAQCPTALRCIAVGSTAPGAPLVETSDDGGGTWTQVDATTGGFASDGAFSGIACPSALACETSAEASNSPDVYAYGTTDGGMTWSKLGLMLTLQNAGYYGGVTTVTSCAFGTCAAISVDVVGPERPSYYLNLLTSDDGGATWLAIPTPYNTFAATSATIASNGNVVAVGTNDEDGPLIVVASGGA